ncbi:MAG TPA: threonine/serine dehydratase [Gemmatimonadales bacterium]|nr:threonine/serine dehydratase [Gemmatimonadales bacterium]
MTVASAPELVSLEAIREAARHLRGVAVHTPLLPSDDLAERLGVPVFVKPESLQRVGAFKLRGAFTLVRQLAEGGARGVITYSSGNHGQAVAWVARRFGLRAVIVMPETVAAPKRRGVERLGGEVVLAGRTSQDRYARALAIAEREGLAVVPPFDHPAIIAGQGTAGLELVEDCPDVRTVAVPVGGGGLAAGVATAVRALRPEAAVVTVEPEGAPTYERARAAGEPVTLERTGSVADGLLPLRIGSLTFAHLARHAARACLVSDQQIVEAVRFALDRLKLVVEPSGAATLAWLLGQPAGSVAGPVVAVLSGGNIEWEGLQTLLGAKA